MKRYASKPIESGFKLRGDDGTERAVCPKAKCTGVNTSSFVFEIDHGRKFEGVLVETVDDPLSLFPTLMYDVPDDVHEIITGGKLKGVSPLITATRIDEQRNMITEYQINGISLQVEAEPVCPSSHCPTKFVGGKKVTTEDNKDAAEKTKEDTASEPEKTEPEVRATPKKKATSDKAEPDTSRDEYVANLIRQIEDLKKQNDEKNIVLKDIEEKKRSELLKFVPEEQAEFAKGLETSALERVVQILESTKASLKKEAEGKKIVEAGAVETTAQKAITEGQTAPAKNPLDHDVFFDRSHVLKPLQERNK